MTWSWTIGRIAGIKLRMHWTFLLLLAWVAVGYGRAGGSWIAAAQGVVFILALFGCVILHELGHALTAARYGVPTEDITLLPIGGVARMQRIPDVPMQEFWIALAGPAVNVVIAAVLFVGLLIVRGADALTITPSWRGTFFINLLWVNVLLVAFNALPAFPMDGGRVLRALLATQMDYARATRIAASIGQAMAILFGIVGLFINPLLLFIALFVYLGAEAEAQFVELRSFLAGLPVRQAMMTQFRMLSPGDTLEHAVDELLAGSQQDFPVVEGTEFRGILSRHKLVEGLREQGVQAAVTDWLSPAGPTAAPASPDASLVETLEAMRRNNLSALPVRENGRFVGLLSMENISELVMVRSATDTKAPPQAEGVITPA